MSCEKCERSKMFGIRWGIEWQGVSLVDQDRLGHDALGHLIANILSRAKLSVDDTASMSADALMELRGLGPRCIQRLRSVTDVAIYGVS